MPASILSKFDMNLQPIVKICRIDLNKFNLNSSKSESSLNNSKNSKNLFFKKNQDSKLVKKKFHCDYCTKSYVEKRGLIPHILRHLGQKPGKKLDSDEKPYKCELCPLKFKAISSLKKHKATHTGEKPYECEICKKKFGQQSALLYHRRTHTGEKPYKCEFCDSSFSSHSQIIIHRRLHTGERPYKCDKCEKGFLTKFKLKEHVEKIHNNFENLSENQKVLATNIKNKISKKIFSCEMCRRGYDALQKFYAAHCDMDNLVCKHCKETFSNNYILMAHVWTHAGKTPYKCKICSDSFVTDKELTIHLRIHRHVKAYQFSEGRHKCEICEKRFAEPKQLVRHKRTHTGLRPFKCEKCGKACVTKDTLNRHCIRIHNFHLPNMNFVKCNICAMMFAVPSQLDEHNRIHTGEKPFKCKICNEAFATKNSLKIHAKVHFGEKQGKYIVLYKSSSYECDYCQEIFNNKKKLLKHVRTHMNKVKAKKNVSLIESNRKNSIWNLRKINHLK